jgi:hypothetical protein
LTLRYRLSPHTDLLIDSSTAAYAFSGKAHAVEPSWVGTFPQASVGTRYRFGEVRTPVATETDRRRWTIGGDVSSSIAAPVAFAATLEHPIGPGMFATYRVGKFIEVDGEVSTAKRGTGAVSAFEGGRATEALAGVRLGARTSRTGFFFKVRLGTLSNAGALQSETFTTSMATVTFHRVNATLTDVGGVFEIYTPHRLTVRFDAGLRQTYYSDASVAVNGTAAPAFALSQTPRINISTGVGWRF